MKKFKFFCAHKKIHCIYKLTKFVTQKCTKFWQWIWYLSIYIFTCLSIYLSIYQYIYIFTSLSIYIFTCRWICWIVWVMCWSCSSREITSFSHSKNFSSADLKYFFYQECKFFYFSQKKTMLLQDFSYILSTFICEVILIRSYVNANIMKIQICHYSKYSLRGQIGLKQTPDRTW